MKFNWLEDVVLKESDFDISDKAILLDDFIFSESLNLIYSPPKQGKTFFGYGIGLKILESEHIDEMMYLDMDNSLSTLKERGVNDLFVSNEKINYITKAKLKMTPLELLKAIANEATIGAYQGILFFLDTIKDFIDFDSKNQSTEFMDCCVKIRDAGGTIIVFHHSTKNGKHISGNQAFINTPDNVFELKQTSRIESILNYTLTVTHARGMVKDTKWSVDTKSLQLVKYNAVASGLTEAQREMVSNALQALRDADDGLSGGQLVEALGYARTDRKGKALVSDLIDVYWRAEYVNAKLTKHYIIEEK